MTKREQEEIERSLPSLRGLPKFHDILQFSDNVKDDIRQAPSPLCVSLDTIKSMIARNAERRREAQRGDVLQKRIGDYERCHGSQDKLPAHSIFCHAPAISVPNSTVRGIKDGKKGDGN